MDKTKPIVTLSTIESDNADTTRAMVGDTITLKFTSDEDLRSTGTDRKAPASSGVKLAGKEASVTAQAGDNTGKAWQATYHLTSGDKEGDLAIQDLSGYTDLAGNPLGWQKHGRALIKKIGFVCLTKIKL